MLTVAALNLSELLSGPYLMNVPDYQRPYSWGTKQVEQLIEDLTDAAGLGAKAVADTSYFLGNILFMDPPGIVTQKLSPKMSTREFEVVDGQQRLVTLITLFCVLRDLDSRKVIGKRVHAMVTAQQGGRFRRIERFRLHIASRDRSIFESFVLAEGKTADAPEKPILSESEKAIVAMRNAINTELKALSNAERAKLFDYVADRCPMVLNVSHDIDRAHRMFVVLNERGKQLQRDDILKADILSRAASADVNWIAQSWDATRAELGTDFESFFSHIRSIYGYDNRQVVSSIRIVVDGAGGAEQFMTNVFLPLAATYQTIRSGNAPGLPPEISRRLQYLNRLTDGDWAPAAMLALKDWERDPDRATLLISEVDRMAHVLRLLCAGAGKRARKFNDIVAALKNTPLLDEQNPVFQLSREESRSIAFHLKDLHARGPKICKLMLMRLSDILSGQSASGNSEDYTIEHILPQRPSATSDWRKLFPTAEDRSACVESIGNLVLITQYQNDKARNASFNAKKAIYTQTTGRVPLLAITAEVLTKDQWRREEIEERETKLLTMIANLLRIEVPITKPSLRNGGPSSG